MHEELNPMHFAGGGYWMTESRGPQGMQMPFIATSTYKSTINGKAESNGIKKQGDKTTPPGYVSEYSRMVVRGGALTGKHL